MVDASISVPTFRHARLLPLSLGWFERTRAPGFRAEADELLRGAVLRAAEDYHLWAWSEQRALAVVRATRTWRLRERLVSLVPGRR